MISTTFNAISVYLFNDCPNWKSDFHADVEILTSTTAGLTNREERRPFSATLRFTLKFPLTLIEPDARAMAAFMRAYQNQPVICPLWPAAIPWGGTALIAGGLNVAFKEDWSQWQIYTTTFTGGFTPDYTCPCLYGYLGKRETPWILDNVNTWDVEFTESGPAAYAITPNFVAWTGGPQPSGYSAGPNLFPYMINWATEPVEKFEVNIVRQPIGFGRTPFEKVYPQATWRTTTSLHKFTDAASIAGILRWFFDYGTGTSFWAPAYSSAAMLTNDVATADTTLSVNDTVNVQAGDYLGFLVNGAVAGYCKVNTAAGTTINLSGTAGGNYKGGQTILTHLLLARFDTPKLSIDWQAFDQASTTLVFRELPAEYTVPTGETLGTTLGILPERGFIYDLVATIDGTSFTTRVTSNESAITYGGNTYNPQKIDHGELAGGLALDEDSATINCDLFTGNPIIPIAVNCPEGPVNVTIREGDISAGALINDRVIFTGEIVKASPKGGRLVCSAVPGGRRFDWKLPRMILQPGCNHAVYQVGCGLAKASFQYSGAVNGAPSAAWPYQLVLSGVTGPLALPINRLVNGWAVISSGATKQMRSIVANTALAGGAITLKFSRPFNPLPANGDTVTFYPGCDGTAATCINFFNNFVNFGGHPYVPTSNPSLVKLTGLQASGSKK